MECFGNCLGMVGLFGCKAWGNGWKVIDFIEFDGLSLRTMQQFVI